MTPVASSFIKGAGAYKGMLLLEFHHKPGQIYGFDVKGQGAEFFRELMNSGSKGGWVWDKILGKPSVYGMAKGKFYSYNQKGTQNFFTSNGAQFVHHYGRPVKFTYNPVGFSNNEMAYQKQSEQWKKWKEKLVEPFWSRNAIKLSKLKAVQEKEYKNLLKGKKVDLIYLGNLTEDSLEECLAYYKKEGKDEVTSKKICFSSFQKNKEKKVEKKTEHIYGTKEMSVEGKEYLKKAFRHIPNHLLENIHIYIHESFGKYGEIFKDSLGFYNYFDRSLNISKSHINEQILPLDLLQYVLTHELGHDVFDHLSSIISKKDILAYNITRECYTELKPLLEKDYLWFNKYAAKNQNEFFAEMFSRYFNVQKNQELNYTWKITLQRFPKLKLMEDIFKLIKKGEQ